MTRNAYYGKNGILKEICMHCCDSVFQYRSVYWTQHKRTTPLVTAADIRICAHGQESWTRNFLLPSKWTCDCNVEVSQNTKCAPFFYSHLSSTSTEICTSFSICKCYGWNTNVFGCKVCIFLKTSGREKFSCKLVCFACWLTWNFETAICPIKLLIGAYLSNSERWPPRTLWHSFQQRMSCWQLLKY